MASLGGDRTTSPGPSRSSQPNCGMLPPSWLLPPSCRMLSPSCCMLLPSCCMFPPSYCMLPPSCLCCLIRCTHIHVEWAVCWGGAAAAHSFAQNPLLPSASSLNILTPSYVFFSLARTHLFWDFLSEECVGQEEDPRLPVLEI